MFSALKTQVPRQAKKRFGVYQKACFQGEQKENTYTPKSLQGVCGGPLRTVLVYRFWPPVEWNLAKKTTVIRPPRVDLGAGSNRTPETLPNSTLVVLPNLMATHRCWGRTKVPRIFRRPYRGTSERGTSENGISHWNSHSTRGFRTEIRTRHVDSHCSFQAIPQGKRRLDGESAL